MILENVLRVEIAEMRWHTTINVVHTDLTEETFVASADAAMTDGAGIWFGTLAAYVAQGESL